MKLKIDWANPLLPEDMIEELQPRDLDDFYFRVQDMDKNNLFFLLLNSLHYYEAEGDRKRAARLSFLAAYYLFITLTPVGSWNLARYYIAKAVSLDNEPEYLVWQALIEKGN